MQKIITNKKDNNNSQELIIVKDLGEMNIFSYDIYPTLLYYQNGKSEKETELYEELIDNKIKYSNIKYDIKYIDYGLVHFPEEKKDSDTRYVNCFIKILNEIKNQSGQLIVIVTHGEGVSECCKYLCKLIKEKSEKEIKGKKNKKDKNDIKLWPDFLNKLNGSNQQFCNSICFKISNNGDISFSDSFLP